MACWRFGQDIGLPLRKFCTTNCYNERHKMDLANTADWPCGRAGRASGARRSAPRGLDPNNPAVVRALEPVRLELAALI
jgi:hypothetical protein